MNCAGARTLLRSTAKNSHPSWDSASISVLQLLSSGARTQGAHGAQSPLVGSSDEWNNSILRWYPPISFVVPALTSMSWPGFARPEV